MDLSQLSDDDLQALSKGDMKKISDAGLSHIVSLAPAKEPTTLSGVAKSVSDKASQFNPEAALQGFGQAATSGYLPQLQSIAGAAMPNPTADVDAKLKSQGFNIQDNPDTYVSRRDAFANKQQDAQEQSPGSYLTGAVGGALASAPAYGKALGLLPGLGTTPNASLPMRLGKAALGGAVQGAVQNPGETEGEVSPLQAKDRAGNLATGALTGAAAQGAGELIGKGAQAVADSAQNLKDFAYTKAVKSSGAMLKDFRRIIGKDRVEELGKTMIDSGLVKPGMTFEDVADKSAQLKQDAGQKIGEIYDQVKQNIAKNPAILNDKLSFISPDNLKQELASVVKDPKVRPKLGTDAYDTQMSKIISDVLGEGRAKEVVDAEISKNSQLSQLSKMAESSPDSPAATAFRQTRDALIKNTQHANLADPRNLNDMIGEIDQKINWSKRTPELSDQQQGLLALRRSLRDKVNQISDAAADNLLGDKTLSSQLKDLNKKYGAMSEINTMSTDKVARENANRMFGLTDTQAGLTGAGVGAVIGGERGAEKGDAIGGAVKGAAVGLGAGLLHKGARLYGNPMLTTGANAAGNVLSKLPLESLSNLSNISKNPTQLGAGAQRIRGASK